MKTAILKIVVFLYFFQKNEKTEGEKMENDLEVTIKFFLYNYYDIDKMIREREKDIIDSMNTSVANWYRGLKSDTNTSEETAILLSEDEQIKRYKEWKELLKEVLFFISQKSRLQYKYLISKYISKKNKNQIELSLKINSKQQEMLNRRIIDVIKEKAYIRNLK